MLIKNVLYYRKFKKLIINISKKESRAIIDFYSLTYNKVYFFVYFLCKNKQIALKILTKVYVYFFESLFKEADFKQSGRYYVYLFNKHIYGVLYEELAEFKKFYSYENTPIDAIDGSLNEEELFLNSVKDIKSKLFIRSLQKLNFRDRSIFMMKYYMNLQEIHIASIFLVSSNEVKSSLDRSFEYIKTILTERSKKGTLIILAPRMYYFPNYINACASNFSLEDEISTKILKQILLTFKLTPKGVFKVKSSCRNTLVYSKGYLVFIFAIFVFSLVGIIYSGTIIFTNQPQIIDVVYEKSFTNKSVDILIEVDNYDFVNEVYAITKKGDIIDGVFVKDGEYKITVSENSKLILTLKSFFMKTKRTIDIDNIDRELPYVDDYEIKENKLYLYVYDDRSGIDFSGSYILTENNNKLKPETYSEEESLIVFTFLNEEFKFYLRDSAGNINEYKFSKA